MKRAQANFLETFPIAAAAILIVQVAGLNSTWTAIGAIVWLGARVAFWVVYAIGIPVVRSVLFATSIVGIGMLRSEEHTSELQSLMRISYAVFCLKKKKNRHKSKT